MPNTKSHLSRAFTIALFLLQGCSDTAEQEPSPCSDGQSICTGDTFRLCENDRFTTEESCAPGLCDAERGCLMCQPRTGVCEGNILQRCRDDGSGYEAPTSCDESLNEFCYESTGVCENPCSLDALGTNYAGCEYYPTITANSVEDLFSFALVVVNDSDIPAVVTVDGGNLLSPVEQTVAVDGVEIIKLPWNEKLKARCLGGDQCSSIPKASEHIVGGAFHLRSSTPVIVYQFSPLNFVKDLSIALTNDASLLLPVHRWGSEYMAASYKHGYRLGQPGLVAITASEDNTQLKVTPTSAIFKSATVDMEKGIESTLTLNQGDVLQLLTFSEVTGEGNDLTGTFVESDKPIQMISGHYCAEVPLRKPFCDHLEESILPISALGTEYLISPPLIFDGAMMRTFRVIATEDNTTVTFDPVVAENRILANAGDYIDVSDSILSHRIISDKKILVVEYMQGQNLKKLGDPSMLMAVPVRQYRRSYRIHAPPTYIENYVKLTAIMGTAIAVDGTPVGPLTPIGTSGFGYVDYELQRNGQGNYQLTADNHFGVSVYGYGQDVSYWYPGGLETSEIVLNE